MKTAHAPVTRASNHRGKKIPGRLNTAKLGLFMKSLISNYNNAELATLREWVSNAHDSHVAAGQKRPVEVTLPTRWSPILTVEDFGVGMSCEDVENIYAVFLSSTKDEDNEGIGGFGIGGKSALALADQYTMIAVKDGLKNIYIFERSNDGGLEVTPALVNEPTDMPNGVKVSVSLRNTNAFSIDSVNSVLRGWKQNEIKLVGREDELKSFHQDALQFPHGVVKNSVFKEKNDHGWYGAGAPFVFVGPVSYELPRSFWNYYEGDSASLLRNFGSSMAIEVPIGSVSFPSSREVIEDTEENNKVVAAAAKLLAQEFQAHVDSLVKNFSSFEEAYAFARSNFVFRTSLKVIYEDRDLTKIKFKGFTQFHVSASNSQGEGLRLATVQDKERAADVRDTLAVIRVKPEDAKLSDDTYRKYIRGAVQQAFVERMSSESRHYLHTVILTTEEDPLYEVTTKVFDYSELRKEAPVAVRSSSPKLTDDERKTRAGEIITTVLKPSKDGFYSAHAPFSSHPAFETEDPILIVGKGNFGEILPVYEYLFGFKNRMVFVPTKLAAKQISMVFPKAIDFSYVLLGYDKKDRKRHLELFQRLLTINKQFGFSPQDSRRLLALISKEGVSEEVRNYFKEDELLAAGGITNLTGYWNIEPHIQALMEHLEIAKYEKRPNYAFRPTAPFSLLRLDSNEKDLISYLNWLVPQVIDGNSDFK